MLTFRHGRFPAWHPGSKIFTLINSRDSSKQAATTLQIDASRVVHGDRNKLWGTILIMFRLVNSIILLRLTAYFPTLLEPYTHCAATYSLLPFSRSLSRT